MRYKVNKLPKSLNTKEDIKTPEKKVPEKKEYVPTGEFAEFEKMLLAEVPEETAPVVVEEHHHHHHSHHHHEHRSEHHHSSSHSEHRHKSHKSSSGKSKPHKSKKRKTKTKKKNIKKIILIILLALLLAAVAIAAYVYTQYKAAMDSDTTGYEKYKYTDEELGIDPKVAEELKDYRNIVLYGLDNTKRSDVILIVSIDKRTKEGKLWTVYRDTYMQLNDKKIYHFSNGDNDFFKCNHAYKKGGMLTSMRMLNRHLDMNIRECVGFDWAAVQFLVDELGGIDVQMTQTLCDFINNGRAPEDQITLVNGSARLNGEQAVAFLRTRKDPGSNAATRSNRNLQTFLNLFELAKTMDKDKLMDLFTKTVGKVETDMSISSMVSLLKDIRSYELEPEGGWPYTYKILWDTGFYYYVPDSLELDVSGMHWKIFEQGEYEVTETCHSLSKMIDAKKGTVVK